MGFRTPKTMHVLTAESFTDWMGQSKLDGSETMSLNPRSMVRSVVSLENQGISANLNGISY